ncbi:MAG: DNA polymerase III subunit delta [Chloroflexi bacterium]|nr:DNA polymerase III subunit delta [Chloroflexota bacterium]
MYYILHGENELARTEQLDALIKQAGGADEFAEMNITRMDGKSARLSELIHACDAVSFLAAQRVVIVEGMLARFNPLVKHTEAKTEIETNPNLAKELIEYLPHLPASTELYFVEFKSLAKNNPLLKFAESAKKDARVYLFDAPDEKNLSAWIQTRVQAKGGAIEPRAVAELALNVGADLRLLDNEIEKLITYCGPRASIRADDVRALVAAVRETSIFELVDAIGRRETNRALKLLHAHLEHKADELYLFAMILRQVRGLLQIKDLAARGLTLDRANAQLKMHPFAAKKMWAQALNFSIAQLEGMYQKLLATDVAIKTGQSEPLVALDLLVVDLTRT